MPLNFKCEFWANVIIEHETKMIVKKRPLLKTLFFILKYFFP